MKLVNIGFGNMVNADRIIAIVSPDSSPVKRMISDGKDKNMLVDATHGRKTKSVLLADSDHLVLSYLTPERLEKRFSGEADREAFDDD